MLSKVISAAVMGVEALIVEVEIDTSGGLPAITVVGLPDAAVRESRERVRAAIRNSGFKIPSRKFTINLAPADVRKEGGTYDLNRSAFRDRERQGLVLSAFFLRRHAQAAFRNMTVRNGPENALKLWNVRDVSVVDCRFEDFFNIIIEFNKAGGKWSRQILTLLAW